VLSWGRGEVSVVAGCGAPPRAESWGATYRIGDDEAWSGCRLLDISLDGGLIELVGELPEDAAELPFVLQIDSIADDEVGITVNATIQNIQQNATGSAVAEVEFSARREERMLLHLLVRLHELV
jgi:hypothetical protein